LTLRDIERRLEKIFASRSCNPTIKIRTKSFPSYYRKYFFQLKSGIAKPVINDLMGVRLVCPFIEDTVLTEKLVKEHFDVVEVERKGHYTFKEFGYESTHLLIKIPPDISRVRGETGCDVIEIQVRSILQDAWAEVEHEIFYKAEFNPVDTPMKRKLSALNASLSLADIVFQEIRDYQKKLSGRLGKRRETFYQKIEEATDALLFSDMSAQKTPQSSTSVIDLDNASIDDLLLNALTAHNENRFEDAITVYSRILELKPEERICSLIYKHRGMTYFAQSRYHEAIADFSEALAMDPGSYRVAYYRGVVYAVLQKYFEAIEDFSLSLKINPYQAFCLFRRGQAYFHVGDYPQALSDCEESLSMDPDKDAVKKFRALVQDKLKL
jgi:putative GTP pyrophosphokinase